MELRKAIKLLKKRDLLDVVDVEVDPYLELSHLTDMVQKRSGQAIYFNRVKGSSVPVVTNLFGNGRLKMFLGIDSYDDIANRINRLLDVGKNIKSIMSLELLKSVGSFREKRTRKHNLALFRGSLDDIPALFSWPGDGGYFYNLGLTHTYNYKTGVKNVGLYRLQRLSPNEIILHWQIHKDGKRDYRSFVESSSEEEEMPVYITFSSPTSLVYAASAPLPDEVNEYNFAGFLRQNPIKTVQLDSEIPIEIAAESEIVLKGRVRNGHTASEGPYGDHTGYYTPVENFPICTVDEIWTTELPVMLSTVVSKPPCEDIEFGKATERIFLPIVQKMIPEIVDYDLPSAGVFHNCLLVKIKKTYPKQANKVMYALFGLGMLSLTKLIIVFDHDCDIHNYYDAAWYALGNVDYGRDIVLLDGPVDHLDHSSYQQFHGGKMGIDATRKMKEEGYQREYPDPIVYSNDTIALIKSKLDQYNIKTEIF